MRAGAIRPDENSDYPWRKRSGAVRTGHLGGRTGNRPLSNDVQHSQFSLPQLLAILRLMRHEDWIDRKAEVRLPALRPACSFDYTTYRFARRLEEAAITRALNGVVHRIVLPGHAAVLR